MGRSCATSQKYDRDQAKANHTPPKQVWPSAANACAQILYVAPVVSTSSTNTTFLAVAVGFET